MKLPYWDFDKNLSQGLKHIYLITGDEPVIIMDLRNKLRQHAGEKGFNESNTIYIAKDEPLTDASFNEVSGLSLFSDKKLVELIYLPNTTPKANAEVLKQYAETPQNDVICVIVCSKLKGHEANTTWYKAINKAGSIVQVHTVKAQGQSIWIKNYAKRKELAIDSDAMQLLLTLTSGNLSAAANDINILAQITSKGEVVDVESIRHHCSHQDQFALFSLCDALMAGQLSQGLYIFERIRSEGVPIQQLLWQLHKTLNEILYFDEKKARKYDADKFITAKKRFSKKNLLQLLDIAGNIDAQIKGAKHGGDAWQALRTLCVLMAGGNIPEILYSHMLSTPA